MDLVEFWIWEHATKHGMAKVLKSIVYFNKFYPTPFYYFLEIIPSA